MVEKLNTNSVFNPTDTAGTMLPLDVEDRNKPIQSIDSPNRGIEKFNIDHLR